MKITRRQFLKLRLWGGTRLGLLLRILQISWARIRVSSLTPL